MRSQCTYIKYIYQQRNVDKCFHYGPIHVQPYISYVYYHWYQRSDLQPAVPCLLYHVLRLQQWSTTRQPVLCHLLSFWVSCPQWRLLVHAGGGGVRFIIGFQPLMVLSPTASWIWWCMQVYAFWSNVDLSCLGRTIYARQFLGVKPPIQFRHRCAEMNHSYHLCWLRATQSVA